MRFEKWRAYTTATMCTIWVRHGWTRGSTSTQHLDLANAWCQEKQDTNHAGPHHSKPLTRYQSLQYRATGLKPGTALSGTACFKLTKPAASLTLVKMWTGILFTRTINSNQDKGTSRLWVAIPVTTATCYCHKMKLDVPLRDVEQHGATKDKERADGPDKCDKEVVNLMVKVVLSQL